MTENTASILTNMLIVAAFAYMIGWISGEYVSRCKNAEEKVAELSDQLARTSSGTHDRQQREFNELRRVLNDVHKRMVAVSKALKIPAR